MRTRLYVAMALGVLMMIPSGAFGAVYAGNITGGSTDVTGGVGGGYAGGSSQQLEVLKAQLKSLQDQQRLLLQSKTGQAASASGGSAASVQLSPTIGTAVQNAGTAQNVRTTQNFQAAVQQLNQLRTQLEALQTMQRGVTGVSSSAKPFAAIPPVTANTAPSNNAAPVLDECGIIPVLSRGGVGGDVSALQRALIGSGNLGQGLDTGFFGNLTAAAVKVFQNKNGLSATGVVDAQTADALNAAIPAIQHCMPIRISKGFIGTLQAATGTSAWGTHVLSADSFMFSARSGAARIGKNDPTTYVVKAANDIVSAKLKSLEGKRVLITGSAVIPSVTGMGFWGLVAQDVSVAPVATGSSSGNGGGVIGGGSGSTGGSGSGSGSTSGSGSGTSESQSAGTTLAMSGSTYLPTALVGKAYSATIGVTGGSGQYAWTFISGDASNQFANDFPAGSGLSMSGGNGSTVTIGGTPAAYDSGKEYFFALRVDSGSEYLVKNFILYVSPATSDGGGTAVSVVLVTPPNWQEPGTVGQPYSTTFLAANEPEGTYQWNIVEGSLPTGLSLSGGNNSETTVSGTPTVAGSYNFKLRVSSTYGGSMQNQYNITIYPGTATSSTSTPGSGVGTQEGVSDASGQQSVLMASILESMKGALQQMLGSLSL